MSGDAVCCKVGGCMSAMPFEDRSLEATIYIYIYIYELMCGVAVLVQSVVVPGVGTVGLWLRYRVP